MVERVVESGWEKCWQLQMLIICYRHKEDRITQSIRGHKKPPNNIVPILLHIFLLFFYTRFCSYTYCYSLAPHNLPSSPVVHTLPSRHSTTPLVFIHYSPPLTLVFIHYSPRIFTNLNTRIFPILIGCLFL